MALWEIVGGSEAGGIVVSWQQLLAARMILDMPPTSYSADGADKHLKLRCVKDEN